MKPKDGEELRDWTPKPFFGSVLGLSVVVRGDHFGPILALGHLDPNFVQNTQGTY